MKKIAIFLAIASLLAPHGYHKQEQMDKEIISKSQGTHNASLRFRKDRGQQSSMKANSAFKLDHQSISGQNALCHHNIEQHPVPEDRFLPTRLLWR